MNVFDADRASLVNTYAPNATISLRALVHQRKASTAPRLLASTDVKVGSDAIAATLLSLPLSLHGAGDDTDEAPTPRIRFDLLVSLDMIVYGTSAHDRPGIMLVCYIDPTGPVHLPLDRNVKETKGAESYRSVCEMQFILQRRSAPSGEG